MEVIMANPVKRAVKTVKKALGNTKTVKKELGTIKKELGNTRGVAGKKKKK